ncbi:MAG: hypothetical protein PHY34_00940 [Patescibacteria group bacterium]|nr:hypothetical protein [Patescibacteria group bacterium]MDD5715805.1 hypothetical protein [Patescibacteria group bacterium]
MSVRSIRRTGVWVLVFCLAVYGSAGMIFGDGPWLQRAFSSVAASVLVAVWVFIWFLIGEMLVGGKK